jgi:hypothetical protein
MDESEKYVPPPSDKPPAREIQQQEYLFDAPLQEFPPQTESVKHAHQD